MRFEVPQFIDVEDKVFGPLTFKQFIYLIGGGGLAYVSYKLLPNILPGFLSIFAWPVTLGFAGLGLALAFYPINGRPLVTTIEAAFFYFIKTRLYLWKKEDKKKEIVKEEIKIEKHTQRISESKLHDIAWGLDVLNKDAQDKQ